MFRNYLLTSIRRIFRNKTLSLINISGLAISMSVCLILIIIIADQLSYDNFFRDGEKIHRVTTKITYASGGGWETASVPMPLADLVDNASGVSTVTRIRKGFSGVAETDKSEIPFNGLFADDNFLSVFSFPLRSGNRDRALELPNSVVLTHELAEKLFGQEDPLDKTITVGDYGTFVITGVLEPFPGKTHLSFDALASMNKVPSLEREGLLSETLDDWENIFQSHIYFKLADNVDTHVLEPVFRRAQEFYENDEENSYAFFVQSLDSITPGKQMGNNLGFSIPVYILYFLGGLALVVIISAVFNYANLTTASALNRSREIGVRKVTGASKWHVFLQFIVEAVIISLLALVIAYLIVELLMPQLNAFLGASGAPKLDRMPYIEWFFILFAVLTGITAGIVPAFFYSKTDPLIAMKKSISLGAVSRRLKNRNINVRKSLVVLQFAFSVFFVITITTIYRQGSMVMNADHGFETRNRISIPLYGQDPQVLKNEFRMIPDVESVTTVSHLPALMYLYSTNLTIPGSEEQLFARYFSVDESFIETLGLDIVAGRNFEGGTGSVESVTIINEKAVESFGWKSSEEALGQEVIVNGDDGSGEIALKIIGVVRDFHHERLEQEIEPMILRYIPDNYRLLVASFNTTDLSSLLEDMEAGWKKHTQTPFEYNFYEDEIEFSYLQLKVLLAIIGYVTVITVSLACLGLLGMVMFQVQSRIKEIGVRKIFGASPVKIAITVMRSFMIMMVIAFLIGGPVAYFVNNYWLQEYAYRVSFGIMTIISGFIMVILLVVVTVGSQVLNAARLNPARTLRDE